MNDMDKTPITYSFYKIHLALTLLIIPQIMLDMWANFPLLMIIAFILILTLMLFTIAIPISFVLNFSITEKGFYRKWMGIDDNHVTWDRITLKKIPYLKNQYYISVKGSFMEMFPTFPTLFMANKEDFMLSIAKFNPQTIPLDNQQDTLT